MEKVELSLTAAKAKALRLALKFTLGSLFALELPKDPDYRGYRVRKSELAGFISYGLRDLWKVAKKVDAARRTRA